ncbi:MAG: zf-HC2 domain-containing protein [Burkholderiaceae bacterium]|nr:zf-HC2 domain-containing protein [Burkholderiaceae bacterium]
MNWMHSCKRVAELLSQRLDEPLGLIDEIKLRLHLSMCGDCRNVELQIIGVHAASADLFAGGLDLGDDADTEADETPGRAAPTRDHPA